MLKMLQHFLTSQKGSLHDEDHVIWWKAAEKRVFGSCGEIILSTATSSGELWSAKIAAFIWTDETHFFTDGNLSHIMAIFSFCTLQIPARLKPALIGSLVTSLQRHKLKTQHLCIFTA